MLIGRRGDLNTSTLAAIDPRLSIDDPACSCDAPADCTFSPARVRWYLIVWRLAQVVHEPFADVLRSESRNSRDIDPWIRGGRIDPERGRLIGLSLERARDAGGFALAPHNAERIAAFLCPTRGPDH